MSGKPKLTDGGKKIEQKGQDFRFVDGEPQVFEISIVVRDLEKSMEQFRSLFGMSPYLIRDEKTPPFYVHGKTVPTARMKYACFHAGPIRIELLEAVEGDSVYAEFLTKRGIGVQHIGVKVSDLDRELAELQKRGIGVLQSMDIPQVIKMAYLDTEEVAGVSFELVESEGIPAEESFMRALRAKGLLR